MMNVEVCTSVRRVLLIILLVGTTADVIAQSERSNDISTVLDLEDNSPRLGDPIKLSLKVKNDTDHELRADKSATAFDCFELTTPDGQAATYVGFMGQIGSSLIPVPAGESVTLAEHLNLTDKYVLQRPGRYSVRFKSGVSSLPDSNTITFDVSPGELTELDKALIRLLPIRPKGWYVTKSPCSQKEVRPFGRVAVAGYDAHICRNYIRGEAVYIWLTKVAAANDPKQDSLMKSDCLGRAQGLYVYVTVGHATTTLWPTAVEDVSRVLQIPKD
jgi:hypothetical protein